MGAGQGPSGRGRDCCVYPSKYVLGLNLNGFSASVGMEKMLSYWKEFPLKCDKARLRIL